ncbi:MAG TPA: type I glyceraldehyde-3-phosphate dehydrogenase [Syntrophorhabdaceae bacterium]|nr:type I glyceraldehyde-3-phosphate dehydrogenase [Syntrophorhabdaceae bacterium]
MSIRVAINGFGRIGRSVLRIGYGKEEIDFVAINDLADAPALSCLLKYDSVHGAFKEEAGYEKDDLIVNGKRIKTFSITEPERLPWKEIGVDVVLESTGKFTDGNRARGHIRSGAGKVIISAPADNADVTVIPGVNDNAFDMIKDSIISMGSCTANCLAPVIKVLDEEYGIEFGFMTTVHAYTKDQPLVDEAHRDLRRGRAAGVSMAPTTTGAFRAISKVMPHLRDRVKGISIRVPTPNVSLVDFVVAVKKMVDRDSVNETFRSYAGGPMKGILSCEEGPLVSCDLNGNAHSAVVDLSSTQTIGGRIAKVIAWYDNEYGFSSRLIDLMLRIARSG